MKIFCTVFFTVACFAFSSAQSESIIFLQNPSFEGLPKAGQLPEGWVNCGFPGESPADIQPNPTFGVEKPPHQGHSYLGMVVRDNDTWESVGQPLHQPLQMDKKYIFQIAMARSEQYLSFSRRSSNVNTQVNYTTPTILRIWAGKEACQKMELLALSAPITHHDWKIYQFELFPQQDDYNFLILEAYYSGQYPLIGNLLLDEASNIILKKAAKNLLPGYKAESDNFSLPPDKEQFYGQPKQERVAVNIVPPVPKENMEEKIEEKEEEKKKEESIQPAGEDQLRTFEDLKWVIKENGQQITFDKGKLEKGFYGYYGRTYFQNVYLHNIISALKIMPEYRIAIAVNGPSNGMIKKRTKQLKKGFEELGLPAGNYLFVDWPDRILASQWIWPANINDLLIRVEKK